MGRNKNKENRSVARRSNGVGAPGNKKRDTGLPTYFKQRKINGVPTKKPRGSRGGDDVEMGGEGIDEDSDVGQGRKQEKTFVERDSFVLDKAARDLSLSGKRDNSAKAFMKDVKNVIENSDVILQVLDARDPLGSRSRQTEVMTMGMGKKLVLIVNKVDLIPTSNLQGWLKYLRNDFPTLAFKSSTQQQRGNLKQGKASLSLPSHDKESRTGSKTTTTTTEEAMSFGSEAVGAASLLQLLKNYARTSAKGSNLKHQLTVGIIGPPNVGKSSLINSLLRTRACAVASTPGWTKNVQGVMLEKGIRLLDCPGVVVTGGQFSKSGTSEEDGKMDDAWNVLRNTVKVELIEDPITPVQALMTKVEADQLSKLYNIEGGFNEGDAHDFLLRVALMRGKLGKGGIADLEGAARIVLHDWNVGRISYHSKVPTVHPSALVSAKDVEQSSGSTDQATAGTSLVTTLGQAFDLEALLGEADAEALGGQGGEAREGKELVQARERRLMGEGKDEGGEGTAIVEDDDGEEAGGRRADESMQTSSTLGKRVRGRGSVDSDSDSNDDDDDDDKEDGRGAADSDDGGFKHNAQKHRDDYDDRLQRKAESLSHRQRDLLTVFSPHEIQGMAQRRGDARRAAKKKKKRLEKSEAGLVDVWNQGMDLPGEEEGHKQDHLSPPTRGLFHVPAPVKRKEGGEVGEADEEEL